MQFSKTLRWSSYVSGQENIQHQIGKAKLETMKREHLNLHWLTPKDPHFLDEDWRTGKNK